MKSTLFSKILLFLLFAFILLNYFTGIESVPFHPDESTQIYMSSDVLSNATDLGYSHRLQSGDKWHYRLIDSPLSRTLIGWGLYLQKLPANRVDWNWSEDWESNVKAGALPEMRSLMTARWSVAWLFPFTCLFLFLLSRKLADTSVAIISVLLFATNALVLIHTRRAMAESTLLCAFCALIWLMVDFQKGPWFSAIAAGLAINAKQTALPVSVFAGFQIFFLPGDTPLKRRLFNTGIFLVIILIILWFLNPSFHEAPLQTIIDGFNERQELSAHMRADYQTSGNPLDQTIILIAQTFIQQPAVYDVLNYAETTKSGDEAYLAFPMNSLFRGFAGGAIMLFLTITGWVILWKQTLSLAPKNRGSLIVFSLLALLCVLMLMFVTDAPFQRYYIILVPFFSVTQAVMVVFIWNLITTQVKKRTAFPGSPPSSKA